MRARTSGEDIPNHSIASRRMLPRRSSMSAMRAFSSAMFLSASSTLKRRIRFIFISSRRRISSRVTSRLNDGFERLKAHVYVCDSRVEIRGIFIFLVLVYSFSMKMRSRDAKSSCSRVSARRISRSALRMPHVVSTLWRSTSLTPRNSGFCPTITAVRGYAYFAVCESIQGVYGFVA